MKKILTAMMMVVATSAAAQNPIPDDPNGVWKPLTIERFTTNPGKIYVRGTGDVSVFSLDNYNRSGQSGFIFDPNNSHGGRVDNTMFNTIGDISEIVKLSAIEDHVVYKFGGQDEVNGNVSDLIAMGIIQNMRPTIIRQAAGSRADSVNYNENVFSIITDHKADVLYLSAVQNTQFTNPARFSQTSPLDFKLQTAIINSGQTENTILIGTFRDFGSFRFLGGSVDNRQDDAYTRNMIYVRGQADTSNASGQAAAIIANMAHRTGLKGAALKSYVYSRTLMIPASQYQGIDSNGQMIYATVMIRYLPNDA